MRYIKIPQEILLLAADGSLGDSVTFADWLRTSVLIDLKFGKTAKDLMQSFDISKKLEKANGVLELSEAEWEAMRDAVNEPTNGYNPRIALQLIPFIRAMLDASNTE